MKPTFESDILRDHIAIVGKTGSGKTSTTKLLIEQVAAAGERVCIIDPIKSDYWGLTLNRDGKARGLPFDILGGPKQHVPLHSAAGKAIGELVARGELRHSIIDMADFEPGGLYEFFVDFAPVLLRRMTGVLYLVMEEAHLFAPKERSGIGRENYSIHWAKTLATAGRTKGIRLVVVTQRTQALHNALLGSCDTMIAHRLTAPADKDPILRWFKSNASKEQASEVERSIAGLAKGEAWVFSGNAGALVRRRFPLFSTFDNTATPESGSRAADIQPPPVDQNRLRSIVGDAVKAAEDNDPKTLKKRIGELELALKRASAQVRPTSPQSRPEPCRACAESAAKTEATGSALSSLIEVVKSTASAMLESAKEHEHAGQDSGRILRPVPSVGGRAHGQIPTPELRGSRSEVRGVRGLAPREARRPDGGSVSAVSGSRPTGGELRILTCVCQNSPDGCALEQLTVLTGYKRSSRNTYLQRLRAAGLVEQDNDRVVATAAGFAALGDDFVPLPVGSALREHWLDRLSGGERAVLDHLISAGGNFVEREDLGEAISYKRSSRNTYIQRLAAMRLVITSGTRVRASDALFDASEAA